MTLVVVNEATKSKQRSIIHEMCRCFISFSL